MFEWNQEIKKSMIFLMILIEKIIVDNKDIKFYNGIDFNIALNHSKDGSDGFIFFFIDNWVEEVKRWNRESKIDSIIKNKQYEKIKSEDFDNSYIVIYQLEGTEPGLLFKIIKDKVLNNNFPEHPWIPISGIDKGAWRIGKTRLLN